MQFKARASFLKRIAASLLLGVISFGFVPVDAGLVKVKANGNLDEFGLSEEDYYQIFFDSVDKQAQSSTNAGKISQLIASKFAWLFCW
jgi:hypothetical protein